MSRGHSASSVAYEWDRDRRVEHVREKLRAEAALDLVLRFVPIMRDETLGWCLQKIFFWTTGQGRDPMLRPHRTSRTTLTDQQHGSQTTAMASGWPFQKVRLLRKMLNLRRRSSSQWRAMLPLPKERLACQHRMVSSPLSWSSGGRQKFICQIPHQVRKKSQFCGS